MKLHLGTLKASLIMAANAATEHIGGCEIEFVETVGTPRVDVKVYFANSQCYLWASYDENNRLCSTGGTYPADKEVYAKFLAIMRRVIIRNEVKVRTVKVQ